MYDVVVKMFTFAISSTDEFLFYLDTLYGFNVKTKKSQATYIQKELARMITQ